MDLLSICLFVLKGKHQEQELNGGRSNGLKFPRVSIYRGHPVVRREKCSMEAGKLIRLPDSIEELKTIAGNISSSHQFITEIMKKLSMR